MANNKWIKIDASDMILGRMCTQIAKRALLGDRIVVVNAKDAVISGNRSWILNKYVKLMDVRTATNPKRGPFHNSRPDTFLRQRIRFMLPKNSRGKQALENIHVYIKDIPKGKQNKYGDPGLVQIKKASAGNLRSKVTSIGEICEHIGWSGSSRELMKQ